MPRCNYRKEERNSEMFPSQSPSGMELKQIQSKQSTGLTWAGKLPLCSWLNTLQQNSFEGGLVASPGPAARVFGARVAWAGSRLLAALGREQQRRQQEPSAAGATSLWPGGSQAGLRMAA